MDLELGMEFCFVEVIFVCVVFHAFDDVMLVTRASPVFKCKNTFHAPQPASAYIFVARNLCRKYLHESFLLLLLGIRFGEKLSAAKLHRKSRRVQNDAILNDRTIYIDKWSIVVRHL